ncbi:MAG: aminotransferase class I/II-fold pyridoxal phosphate-dependent enzyme [Hyphomicrobiales bacterium]|nr:aminotransferase class I/II-fold pyridoxal phosphate-dependent enzyme [Hyphomicrobiales bacterium]
MTTSLIDLRSDTVTLPTERMREAMASAPLGDDSRDGDPTVRRLEALGAERAGKEAGLFLPSGTMANLVALLAHTGRGVEVLVSAGSHISRTEMGGVAGLASLFHRELPAPHGAIDLEALREALSPGLAHNRLATGLVAIETSHNDAGGTVPSLEHMASVQKLARERGVPVHIDGARLFNAAQALGVQASRITAFGDSVGFCVSKGLSAPIGSVLCGSAAFIERARAFRRMVGGNLRQAGVVAAAGIVALEEMIGRLAEDHRRAKELASGIAAIDASLSDPREVETNIVNVDLSRSAHLAPEWAAALKARGILAGPTKPKRLRLLTHRHIGDGEVKRALAAFREVHAGMAGSRASSLPLREGV